MVGLRECVCCCFSVKRQCEEKEQRLAVLEENFASTQKEVTELRSCLREVERSRLEARRELQELRRQVRRPSVTKGLCFLSRLRLFPHRLTALCRCALPGFSTTAEGAGWREGAERDGGGRAADTPGPGGTKR